MKKIYGVKLEAFELIDYLVDRGYTCHVTNREASIGTMMFDMIALHTDTTKPEFLEWLDIKERGYSTNIYFIFASSKRLWARMVPALDDWLDQNPDLLKTKGNTYVVAMRYAVGYWTYHIRYANPGNPSYRETQAVVQDFFEVILE